MKRSNQPGRRSFRPEAEVQEERVLLSGSSMRSALFLEARFFHPARPNTPVLPFAAASNPTYIDPTVRIAASNQIAIASKDLIAPFAVLDARGGFIKIGAGSTVQDNARILANPQRSRGAVGLQIGDEVVISAGATVDGPSNVGAFGSSAKPTYVGPNAVIDGATIEPGAYVSALARVRPGILIPAGIKVLPGANVTTEDQATNPALGMVTSVTAADTKNVTTILSNATAIANGYTSLYQGQSATGTLGSNVTISDNVVIGGNSMAATVIDDNVSIGTGAVIAGSTLGAGASIGANAHIANSSVAAGATISPGTVLVDNKAVGFVR